MEILITLLTIYSFILLARALWSWVDAGYRSPIGQLLVTLTEPVVAPIRQVMPNMGGIDLSVMVAMFLVYILRSIIAQSMI